MYQPQPPNTLKTSLLIILCFLGLFQGTAFSAKKENCIAGKGKVCQQPPSSIAGAPNPKAFRINNAPTSLNVPNTFTPTTSGGVGIGSVSYSSSTPDICEVESNTVRANTPGTCTITATKNGDSEYGSATNTISFSVNPAPPIAQTTPVTLTSSASSIFSGGTVTLTARGGNGTGALSLSGSGSCSLTAGDVSNEEARATLTGTNTSASATTCSVTATRAASEGYLASNPSSPVTISINPLQTQAPLNFDTASLTFTNNIAVLNASGGSGNGAITYASNTPSICSVSGTSLTRIATGTCEVRATKAASGTYESMSAVANISVTMNPCPDNVDFCNTSVSWSESPRRSGVTSITVSFKANPTVTKACLAFTSGSRSIGSPTAISGSEFHTISGIFGNGAAVNTGGIRLVKNSACESYPASGFTLSSTIATGWATGLFITNGDALGPQAAVGASTNPASIPPGTTAQITGTGGSGNGAFTFQSSTPSICTISGSTITGVANGTCRVSVTRAASGLYLEATANIDVPVGCAVNKQIEYRNDSSCTLAATTDLGQACVSEINSSGSVGTYNSYSMLCYSDKQCLYVSRTACGDGTCDSPWELRAWNQIYPSATASQIRSGGGTSACKVGNW